MLAPETRTLLLDALRPPIGMRLDHAVATTFTLDLNSALVVPLALAGFNLTGTPDLPAVMEALRSTSSRVDVFAQAGMVKAAMWPGDLAALLETSIHTVHRPRPGHLFHPKLWVLRFVDEEGEASFRCVVTSRNLTSDRSWDVILRLDSDSSSTRVNPDNDGLVRLITALPDMAGARLGPERRDRIAVLGGELRRVSWQMPDGADRIRFLAFGVSGGLTKHSYGTTFKGYRHLLISPFFTAGGLAVLLGDSAKTEATIVSRADQLDAIERKALEQCALFTLNSLAGLDDGEQDDADDTGALLGELHAKVYVIESNNRSYVYVGSANATDAAFDGNVEILCEVGGGPKTLGVTTMLDDKAPFRTLLERYESPAEVRVDERAKAQYRVDAYLVDLAECDLALHATPAHGGFAAALSSEHAIPIAPPGLDVSLSIAPYSQPGERFPLAPGLPVAVTLPPRPAADLTAFFEVRATAKVDGHQIDRATVLRATISGDPPERFDDILIRQLDTPEKFLRFLMLLLSLGGESGGGLDASEGIGGVWSASPNEGLLELLVRALAIQPESIDRLADIVERMEKSAYTLDVFPPGWGQIWTAIREARLLVGRRLG